MEENEDQRTSIRIGLNQTLKGLGKRLAIIGELISKADTLAGSGTDIDKKIIISFLKRYYENTPDLYKGYIG